ncbi:CLUMA_CG020872, isoform A [Clunio marinus]|uniref:CLUMA_CG020872, isoform A n=1 Tax=Clunio marinus TaxID=568069 RepID=A0A1J1J8I3_9DIPT|nr:CLUMA_CG020872, isoform A [Clunio marinus]
MKTVNFQDVVYEVQEPRSFGSTEKTKRQLLKAVSGVFRHGQLSVIMGPSGAGKSSLLNALSGYRTEGVSGNIFFNRKSSCYIQQEDCHHTLLTVEEMMTMACRLKLKNSEKSNEQEIQIRETLTSLNLLHRSTSTASTLSGGERKRLSIALELVTNPSIIFLDEPTSGLDEVTAASCIRLLKELAHQDRTIICTIHQPSAAMFENFDSVYLLAKGMCVYQGSPKTLIPFLQSENYICPKYNFPADYIIELCDLEPETVIPHFSNVFQNGKQHCIPVISNDSRDFLLKPLINSLYLESIKPKEGTFVQKVKLLSKFFKSEYALSSLQQFSILFQMMMTKIYRNRVVLWIQFFHHFGCGLFIGIIFFNSANDGSRMFDHLKFCMGCVFFAVYTQIMVPILSYPSELRVVKKECFNRWYGLTPYYLALTISRLPLQILLNVIFSTLVYFLAGLPLEMWRFIMFSLIGNIVSIISEGLGLAIGATFNVTNGCAVGPMCMAPFLGLAIYGFDFAAEIPVLMNAAMKLSFIRGGVVSLVLTVFGHNRPQLNCKDVYCHFDDPKVLLRYLRIEDFSLVTEIAYLVAIMVIFRTLFYLSLRKRFYK